MQNESPSAPAFLIHNGMIRNAAESSVSLSDGAIRWGQAAFETLVAYQGIPFLPTDHFARLRHAAAMLDLHCPSDAIILEAMGSLLRQNGLDTAHRSRLRITLTSPAGSKSMIRSPAIESWFIEATLLDEYPEKASVITIPYARNDRSALAGLKTVNYGENVIAQKLALESGADEAIFGNTRNLLCEGTWSNIFVFLEGSYHTPPLSSGCLPGVTRALILELSRDLGIKILETDLPMSRLPEIEAAFLTSSLREIQPVSSLNGSSLSEPPDLVLIRNAFRNRVTETLKSAYT